MVLPYLTSVLVFKMVDDNGNIDDYPMDILQQARLLESQSGTTPGQEDFVLFLCPLVRMVTVPKAK